MSVYEGIMEGLGEALAHAEGKRTLRTTPMFEPVREYKPDEIKKLRADLGMTQVVFAGFLGVSPKTVEAWEAGTNTPSGPALRLMTMIMAYPDILVDTRTFYETAD